MNKKYLLSGVWDFVVGLQLCPFCYITEGYIGLLMFTQISQVKLHISPDVIPKYYSVGDVRCITYI